MKKDMENVFERVAEQNGISAEEVKKEIAASIADAKNLPDGDAKEFWGKMGEDMTPEKLLAELTKMMKKKKVK